MLFQEYLPPAILLTFVLWAIGKSRYFALSGVDSKWLQLAFLLKVASGFILYFLYTYYYTSRSEADTFKYFDDSRFLYEAFWSKPSDFFKMLFGIQCENSYFEKTYFAKMNNWYLAYDNGLLNDSRLVIRLNAVFRFISFGNYHIHNLLLNLLSFIGLYSLMRLFIEISGSKWKSYAAAFLVPSTIFWSSGILKEAILLFALGLFCLHFFRLATDGFNWRKCLLIIVLTPLLLAVKLYVFMALVTASIGFLIAKRTKRYATSFLFSCIVFFALAILIGYVLPSYSFVELLVQKQHDFVELAERTAANSFIKTPKLDHSFRSILQNLPIGLLNSLTRPWPSDVRTALFVPPLLENSVILLLIFLAFLKRKKLTVSQNAFVWFSFTFVLILFSIIGITSPIIGAIVRYKIPALPFLFLSLFMLLNYPKLETMLETHISNKDFTSD